MILFPGCDNKNALNLSDKNATDFSKFLICSSLSFCLFLNK